MKKSILLLVASVILVSCGNGIFSSFNMRPKPWTHPFVPDAYTGIDTLIHTSGYYLSEITDTVYLEPMYSSTIMKTIYNTTDDKTDTFRINTSYTSVVFYENGLCAGVNNIVGLSEGNSIIPTLDTLFSHLNFQNGNTQEYYKSHLCWGTYEICEDTIKTYLIKDVLGDVDTRKNIITNYFLISENKQLTHIYISNSNNPKAYRKALDNLPVKFYPLGNKINYKECPYLEKKWFYRNDNVK